MKCLTVECESNAVARGLCSKCSMAARRAVARKETTWEQLEAIGMALPHKDHRGSTGLFLKNLRSKTGNEMVNGVLISCDKSMATSLPPESITPCS